MLLDRAAKFSGGMRMYVRYAELLQRPSVCIMESSIPWEAAVVAAPLLKLWPEYKCACIPALVSALRNPLTNLALVNGVPSWNWKNGPGLLPLSTR